MIYLSELGKISGQCRLREQANGLMARINRAVRDNAQPEICF